MEKGVNRRKTIVIMVCLGVALITVVVASYALFQFNLTGNTRNTISTGTLELQLDEEKQVTLYRAFKNSVAEPVSDNEGLSSTPYRFTVRNTGTKDSRYRIMMIDDEEMYARDGCSKLPWDKVKYSITMNQGAAKIQYLSFNNGILDETILPAGGVNTYEIRLWIDSKASNEIVGLHFHSKINIKGILSNKTDYDTGA